MNIGLLAVDSDYPNLALMKLARYHRNQGDTVEWYNPFDSYDILYMAKVFTFSPDYGYVINNAGSIVKGGTGYDVKSKLPDEIDRLQPDYSIYPGIDPRTAYGFTTRGCIRRCKWCVVPKKEGRVKPYMDVDEIAIEGRTHLILMDNNVLASDYGLEQMEKTIKRGYRVDYNQALDARLVTDEIASLLARVRWIRHHGWDGEFFLYTILLDDFNETFARVNHWKNDPKVMPFAQPYRDLDNPRHMIPQWQKDMSRWVNRKEFYRKLEFADFKFREGVTGQDHINENS